jgi:hypothetical protein
VPHGQLRGLTRVASFTGLSDSCPQLVPVKATSSPWLNPWVPGEVPNPRPCESKTLPRVPGTLRD